VDAFVQCLGRRQKAHVHQFGFYLLGLFLCCFLAFLGMDSENHLSDLGNSLPEHLGQDVPLEGEDAALSVITGQSLVYGFQQSESLVVDHQPDPRKVPDG
jgi:hypothetical protein